MELHMNRPLKVLILEDVEADAELIVHELKRSGFELEWTRVDTEVEYLNALSSCPDLILADFNLPAFDAFLALRLMQERSLDIPFIVISGTIREETAVEFMKQGASDYLLKDRMTRLGQAVVKAIEKKDLREEKRNALERLRREHEQRKELEEVVNRSPIVVFLLRSGMGWPVEMVSDNVEQFGYSTEDFTSGRIRGADFIHPDDLLRIEDDVRKHATDGELRFIQNYRIITKDGQIRSVEDRTTLRQSPSGEITHLQGILIDVTSKLQAEEALKESEQLYSSVVGQAFDMIFLADVGTRAILVGNAAFQKMLGYDEADLSSVTLYDIIAHDKQSIDQNIERIRSLGSYFIGPGQYRRKDGSIIDVEASSNLVRYGKKEVLCVIARDVTQRKQAMLELRKSEEKYRLIVENQTDLIVKTDSKGRFLYASPSYCDLFGVEESGILGTNYKPLVHPDDRNAVAESFMRLISPPYRSYCEERTLTRNGWRWLGWASRAILDERGSISAFVAAGRDLTEKKHVEEELQRANYELKIAIDQANESALLARQANAAKSEFLANISHEIRTPLNGVIGMIGLLQDMNLSEEEMEYAKIARVSGETLLSLINEILDFSKIEARKMELETLDFDLRSLMKDTVNFLYVGAQKKDLQLSCFIHGSVPTLLRGDPGRLRQILVNLGGNAVKFTDKGKITIRVSLESEDEKNAIIRFNVIDTGMGIPKNRQDVLFTPFTQMDSSPKRKHGGTGLGLAISKQLAELMGGTIGVESEEGVGSSFYFTARFEKQRTISSSPEERSKSLSEDMTTKRIGDTADLFARSSRRIRILVAEDNPVNQKVAVAMLKNMSLNADVVADGREAIAALQSIPYDLVLMDCHMPEMDGFEATRIIRHDGSGVLKSQIPIIALTASTLQSDRDRCIQAGMSDFIPKPVNKNELAQVLFKWLK
jgi:PAS domain S-box-containing protein